MSSNGTYAFFGRIYPENAGVNISQTELQHMSQFGTLQIEIFAHGSQLLIEVQTEDTTNDIFTIKNLVKSSVSSLTDPLSFLVGKRVNVEILGVITPSGRKRVFGVELHYISGKISQEEIQDKWLPKIMDAYQTEASPYIQRAFRDYRLAMEYGEDTGFYCFRAIESLRQFFKNEDDAESWERLRDTLDVDRSTIEDGVQNYSKKRRHGDVYSITGEERQQILETTWDIIKRFIEFADEELENDVVPEEIATEE